MMQEVEAIWTKQNEAKEFTDCLSYLLYRCTSMPWTGLRYLACTARIRTYWWLREDMIEFLLDRAGIDNVAIHIERLRDSHWQYCQKQRRREDETQGTNRIDDC
jgi:hypothetical protein